MSGVLRCLKLSGFRITDFIPNIRNRNRRPAFSAPFILFAARSSRYFFHYFFANHVVPLSSRYFWSRRAPIFLLPTRSSRHLFAYPHLTPTRSSRYFSAYQVVPLWFPRQVVPLFPPLGRGPFWHVFGLCYLCAFSSYSSIYLVQKTPLVARERWDHLSAPGPEFRCPGIEIAYKQEPLETTLKYFNSEKRSWVLGEVGILKHHFEGLRLLATEPSCAARGGAEPSIQTCIKFGQK